MQAIHAVLLLASLGTTWFLTGLIWTIQVDGYPLFAFVGREAFTAFESEHTSRITPLVGPVMAAELLLAIALVFDRPMTMPLWLAWIGAGTVGVIWISTGFVQVPLHDRLGRGFDADAHRLLVTTNWVRTIAWTLRAGSLTWVTWRSLATTSP
jgi:hypothetical protein